MAEILASMKRVGRTFIQGIKAVRVLEAVTGNVEAGARIAILGPSGSGKSTLLHLLGGMDRPTTGSITWPALGSRNNLSPQKVGFVFQTSSLFETLTALENVELPLLLAGVPPGQAKTDALQSLTDIGLTAIADKLPEELSGGQVQRVAVARALTSRPRLVLMDEPTGQLDQPTAQHLFDILLDSLNSETTAVIVATHDPMVAARMNTIWQLSQGRLKEVARP